ncbi:hypothetical protein DAPPUDRAFT_102055 [Daphnia pulex]|uniref:Uncharacterized protein n=1 Tax=Daphnia pulex TaxID=6669 RepID=E9GF81_DAPPU|nr:hypothetical protein DAPPUDRAFT_102055 [Daphnia pulex]|eukprot:EFX81855.1 hypothetical protein DAPPUDRAFT_102055 [Daphnia pulex]
MQNSYNCSRIKKLKVKILPQNFGKLIPNGRVLVSPSSGDTLISKKNANGLTLSNEVEDDSLCASGLSGSSTRLRSSTLTNDAEEKDLEGRDSQMVHHNQPALVTVYKDLKHSKRSDSVYAIPQAVIEIPLPIPVQTAIDSYKFVGGKKPDGSIFVIADLNAYQNSYTVKKSDMKVTFVEI